MDYCNASSRNPNRGNVPIWTAVAYLDCAACSALNAYRMGGGAFVSV